MLTTIEKVDILQKAPVFQGVRTESLARVAAIAREVSCDARQLLFRENEGADTMFLILEGRVALVRNGQQAQELAAGQVAGALALLACDSQGIGDGYPAGTCPSDRPAGVLRCHG